MNEVRVTEPPNIKKEEIMNRKHVVNKQDSMQNPRFKYSMLNYTILHFQFLLLLLP